MKRRLFIALLVGAVMQTVHAQAPAKPAETPPASSATAAASKAADPSTPINAGTPKHGCKKPNDPGKFATESQMRVFRGEIDQYRDCLTAYRDDMNKRAKAFVESANAAIQEFNDFIAQLNDSRAK